MMDVQLHLSLGHRMTLLRLALPVGLGALTVFYEIGPGRRIHDVYGARLYFDLDTVFYGLIVPVLTFGAITLAGHWIKKMQHAEQQAQASEQRLAAILFASVDAILTVDLQGRIESWNHGAELLFGYSMREMKGQSLSLLFDGGERAGIEHNWLFQTVQQAGFVRGHETICRTALAASVI